MRTRDGFAMLRFMAFCLCVGCCWMWCKVRRKPFEARHVEQVFYGW